MTMITPSYLGETIEYSSLHACRSTLEDPTSPHLHVTLNLVQPVGYLLPSWLRWCLRLARNSVSPAYGLADRDVLGWKVACVR